MGQITWTAEAERWLRDIHDYIAADNPAAAGEVVAAIRERAQVLQQFPLIGQLYAAGGSSVRFLVYSHYRSAYRTKANRDVVIVGVFHGALEIDRYLL